MADDNEELSMAEAVAAFTGTTDGAQPEAEANSDDDLADDADVGADDGQPEPDEDEDSESADLNEDDEEGDPDDEGQADDEDDGEPEAGAGKFAADDHRVKLSDGTYATVAELKAGNLRDRDYRQKTMEVAEARKAIETSTSQIEQQKSQLQEQFEYNQALLQSLLPKAPDQSLLRSDPLAYMEQKQAYEDYTQHLNYIQQQLTGTKAEQEAKQAGNRNERLEKSWNELLTVAPELQDAKKVDALVTDFRTYGTEYGFTPQELAEVPLDHRQVLVLRKAIAWDKLQAKNKAAKQPIANEQKRPPVQKGGKRLNGGDIKARERSDAMAKLNKSGSVKDGIAAYLASQGG